MAMVFVACSESEDAPPNPEDLAFTMLPSNTSVELIPTHASVFSRCAAFLGSTYCTPTAALTAARACRAQLSAAERAACDPMRGCLVPYVATRTGACVAGSTYTSAARCEVPVADNCAFYRQCLDASHACGNNGYALGFGERICYLFIERREEFSPEGQRWLRDVRTCLQHSLVSLLNSSSSTCDGLADEAYASHTRCYTAPENSFCMLPPSDVLQLVQLLGPYLRDPRVSAQTEAVATICAARSRP
jgi:hypothetical protein